jgi:hypothetical protein
VAKDKKKKKSKMKSVAAPVSSSRTGRTLKSLSDSQVVADVVAAALVATASALKDAKKAQRLAASAGDELAKLSKKSARQGSAMWQLALDVGRHALDTLSSEIASKGAPKAAKKAKPRKAATTRKPAAKARAASAQKTVKSTKPPKSRAKKPAARRSRARPN